MKRSTKIITTVGLILLLLVISGVALYFYLPIGEIDPETGERQTLEDFFPFADSGDDGVSDGLPNAGTSTPPSSAGEDGSESPALREITNQPVAGAVVVLKTRDVGTTTTETFPQVRYLMKGNGHVLATPLDIVGSEDTILNETVTKVQRAKWAKSGTDVILQRFTDSNLLQTQYLTFTESSDSTTTLATDVQRQMFSVPMVTSFSAHPDESRFVVVDNMLNIARVKVVSPSTGNENVIYNSPLSEWLVDWPSPSTITIATKPSSNVAGYLYTIDTTSGAVKKILGGINGLTARMSPEGSYVLYSESGEGGITLRILNRETGELRNVPFRTLPEKCAWSNQRPVVYCAVPVFIPDVDYPDDWYKGEISFSDELWSYNIQTNQAEKILTPTQDPWVVEIDMTKLSVGPNEEYILFTNKKDGSLWSYRLTSTPDPSSSFDSF